MNVVVTGAGGFVGRQLVARLLARGDSVVGVDSAGQGIPEGARRVVGDIADVAVRRDALRDGCEAIVHLATVPGGAAEVDPAASRRINIDATYDLMQEAAALQTCPRFVFASTIGVFSDPFPPLVDDTTPFSPKMFYGAHKAMMELAAAMFANRGLLDSVTVRLSGILARPRGPSGMKSAFMSEIFHALKAGETFVCPVSAKATIWAQSLERCAANFLHALDCDSAALPATRTVTLPALRFTMGDLAEEIAQQCGITAGSVRFQPDPKLEESFGAQPPLRTPAAEAAGFRGDADLPALVASVLRMLDGGFR